MNTKTKKDLNAWQQIKSLLIKLTPKVYHKIVKNASVGDIYD